MKHRLIFSFTMLILSAGLSQQALADPVIPNFTLTLSSANQGTVPGTILSYSGTIANTSSSTIYLNGIDFTSATLPPPGFTSTCTGTTPCIDESPFFSSPIYLTAAGTGATSFYTGVLFNVGVPTSSAIANFSGFVDIVGGSDPFTNIGNSNIVGFSTNVTPEPSSWLLMATGLLGLVFAYRFRPQSAPAMIRR